MILGCLYWGGCCDLKVSFPWVTYSGRLWMTCAGECLALETSQVGMVGIYGHPWAQGDRTSPFFFF